MKENLFMEDCIRTRSGLYVNVFNPTPDMFCIEDVAWALSKIPRFMGHLKYDYTVLMHSILACQMTKGDKFEALMHDCTEAYLGDLPRPIKKRLTQYQELENNLRKVMAQKFGFNPEFSEQTHMVDSLLLHAEWEALMLDVSDADTGLISLFTAQYSKEDFIKKFLEFYHQYKPQTI